MAMRFQRRITILPGVRVNLSKSGLGLSVGPRGASISMGKRGVHQHLGIPGTGLAWRNQLTSSKPRSGQKAPIPDMRMRLGPEGEVLFELPDGSPAAASDVNRLKRERGDELRAMLTGWVDTINADLAACLSIHTHTPPPVFRPYQLSDPEPVKPAPRKPRQATFFDKLLGRRGRIDRQNQADQSAYEAEVAKWARTMDERTKTRDELRRLNEGAQSGDPETVERIIEERLSSISWAKETGIAFDFGDNTKTLRLDIDLPTIEEIPDTAAVLPARGVALRMQKRSPAQKRRDFSYLAHATLFRVAGEAFAALPGVQQVTVSGCIQRDDPATGRRQDVHIISVRIDRQKWEHVDFRNLTAIDVELAIANFDLVKNQARNGEFKPIEPIG